MQHRSKNKQQCLFQHRSTITGTIAPISGTVSSTVQAKSSHNPAP
ncbi:hypothetical protein ECMP0215613_5333 [Escherichia coli MP021561.3]|nr:hypothetical protein ECMP0215613_5333 [Escherichia coli MP021561.3]